LPHQSFTSVNERVFYRLFSSGENLRMNKK
jgi:hypothetical protein